VGRALTLLQAFRPDQPAMSLSDLARKVGLDKATTRRLLLTMQHHGFIEQDSTSREYVLGPTVIEIGAAVKTVRELRDIVRPVMFELANETQLAVYVCVVSGNEALCVERVQGTSPVLVQMLHTRIPLNCGAAPRVLLAGQPEPKIREVLANHLGRMTARSQMNPTALRRDLAKIRARGWELAVDDITIGAAGLGVPLHDRSGNVVAAMAVGGLTHHVVKRSRPRFVEELRFAARQLRPRLQFTP
jgi:DNA-binding IclR family transcriptional regulator